MIFTNYSEVSLEKKSMQYINNPSQRKSQSFDTNQRGSSKVESEWGKIGWQNSTVSYYSPQRTCMLKTERYVKAYQNENKLFDLLDFFFFF